jgi:hypothetical protein
MIADVFFTSTTWTPPKSKSIYTWIISCTDEQQPSALKFKPMINTVWYLFVTGAETLQLST